MCFIYLLLAVFLGPAVPVPARGVCRDSFREVAPECPLACTAADFSRGSSRSYPYHYDRAGVGGRRDDCAARSFFAGLAEGCMFSARCGGVAAERPGPALRLADAGMLPLSLAAGWRTVCIAVVAAVAACAAGCLLRCRRRLRRLQPPGSRCIRELPAGPDVRLPAPSADGRAVSLSLIDDACRQLLEHGPADGFIRRHVDVIRSHVREIEDWVCDAGMGGTAESAGAPDGDGMLDITRFCGRRVRAFEEYAEVSGISYRVDMAGELLFPLSRDTLAMMVDTLLSAAFRRAGAGGEVAFRAAAARMGLRIAVSVRSARRPFDSTPGRLHGWQEDPGQDMPLPEDGAELAVCHGLAAKLRGEFLVVSEGDATTYTLWVPGPGDTRAKQPAPEPEVRSGGHSGHATAPDVSFAESGGELPAMLVINEDRDLAALVREVFAGEYDIAVLDDLDRAAGLLAVLSPQIIVCGTASSDETLDGIIRAVRRTRRLAQVPVMLLTVGMRPDMLTENPVPGADVCLTLPFDLARLRSVAAQLLRRYESRKDYGHPAYGVFDLAQGRMLHRDDKAFLDKMLGIIRRNILDPSLSTQFIAGEMGMSLPNFYRKLGGITDQTPACIVREYRLGMAEQLLVTTKLSIDEIIYKSGFSNRSTFFRGFVARFGCTPKTYRERKIREAVDAEAV